MRRAGRTTKSVALGAALLCAATFVPRIAGADPDRRGEERRQVRHEGRDDRRQERCDDRHCDRHDHRRYDRYSDRHHEQRWEQPRGRVVIRIGGPPVVYCPPPAPRHVRMYYDPYCRTNFGSLALFSAHALRHGHISFVWVLEDGQPRYAYRHARDRWERCDEWWPREGWHHRCD